MKIMDKTSRLFDNWAKAGRAEDMEAGHGLSVNKFLDRITFEKPFTFLDIGCGNGWVVRKIAGEPKCKKSVGIDKSKIMIQRAKTKQIRKKECYFETDLASWMYKDKFDVIFSMESLYYSVPMESALKNVFQLLKKMACFIVEQIFTKTTNLQHDGLKTWTFQWIFALKMNGKKCLWMLDLKQRRNTYWIQQIKQNGDENTERYLL